MMHDPELLISLYLNGDEAFQQEHLSQLSGWIQQSPENASTFVHAAFLHRAIHDSLAGEDIQKNILLDNEESEMFWDSASWQAFAEEEKNAPRIVIEKPAEELAKPRLMVPVTIERKERKVPVFTLVVSVAAMLFLAFMVFVAPKPSPAVAVLTDSVDAEWMTTEEMPVQGGGLRQGELTLAKGVAEITFDDGAVVVVEAPAVLNLESAKSMFVTRGRISAVVSKYATGFTVNTPSSSVVDLGTEFGLSVQKDGSSSLHLFKGTASLITGQKGQTRTSQTVNANEARHVDFATGTVTRVPMKATGFVRCIDSQKRFVWRGESLSLADIVGGGNGFGTGRLDYGIHPVTGQFVPSANYNLSIESERPGAYASVADLPFIDGVFIPNRAEKSVVTISSEGHIFTECPLTQRTAVGLISYGAWRGGKKDSLDSAPRHALRLGGIRYDTKQHPGIEMHANKGITFDLEAMRRSLPEGLQIDTFVSQCGVSETVLEHDYEDFLKNAGLTGMPKVDFWVLVDGQLRFSKEQATTADGAMPIDVKLSPEDRFLTLVVTDGGDKIYRDWALFARPELVLVEVEEDSR